MPASLEETNKNARISPESCDICEDLGSTYESQMGLKVMVAGKSEESRILFWRSAGLQGVDLLTTVQTVC